jgi:signal transduction histidine kinase
MSPEDIADLILAVSEAFNNAVRHAGASSVTVRISRSSDAACISVSDDGRMDKPLKPRLRGGIDNMKTRARLIAANLSIGRNAEQSGTLVRIRVPCPELQPSAAPAALERS